MRFDSDFAMLIGGAMELGSANFAVVNPATEEEFAQAPEASEADLDRAVAAARAAFPGWSATCVEDRRTTLRAMAKALVDHQDALMRLLTQEQGKPHADALSEVLGAAHWLEGAASLDIPVTVNEDSEVRYSETRRVPIGVVGAIAPWNYPLLLAMFKVGPALLTGNTLVLKPSPFTPLTTLKFGELVKDCPSSEHLALMAA
jgi:acyl-CoA reductase-like NAD-dependent aldehyde dehydrogenase